MSHRVPTRLSDVSSVSTTYGPVSPIEEPPENEPARHEAARAPIRPPNFKPLEQDEEGQGFQSRASLFDRAFTNSWGLEVLSWLSATLILVILLVVFAIFDGKPLTDWHSDLTLNTIISILSQIAQMLLLVPIAEGISQLKWLWFTNKRPITDMPDFDKASRGPIDSLVLLWKRRQNILVYLGVASMVLQVLFQPFAQQALQLPTRRIVTGVGSIPKMTQYFAPYSLQTTDTSNVVEAYFSAPVPEMRAAISTGLLGRRVDPSEVRGSSNTGNCTFEPYWSMGVCSSVEDVTSSLVADCKGGGDGTDSGCTYTIPELRNLNAPRNVKMDVSDNLWIGAGWIEDDEKSFSEPNTLIEFCAIYLSDLDAKFDPKVNYTSKMVALKGKLDLCLIKYDSSMEFGTTTTTKIDQRTDITWKKDSMVIDNHPVDTISTTTSGAPDKFEIPTGNISAFNFYLSQVTFIGSGRADAFPTPRSTSDAANAILTRLYGQPVARQVRDGRKALSDLLSDLSASMTNSLRTTSAAPRSVNQQFGRSYSFEVYIDVVWAWLVAPIATVPFTIFFLLAIIFRTRNAHVPAWKSSQLAAILALHPNVRNILGGGMMPSHGMDETARHADAEVRLEAKGDGKWQLAKVD